MKFVSLPSKSDNHSYDLCELKTLEINNLDDIKIHEINNFDEIKIVCSLPNVKFKLIDIIINLLKKNNEIECCNIIIENIKIVYTKETFIMSDTKQKYSIQKKYNLSQKIFNVKSSDLGDIGENLFLFLRKKCNYENVCKLLKFNDILCTLGKINKIPLYSFNNINEVIKNATFNELDYFKIFDFVKNLSHDFINNQNCYSIINTVFNKMKLHEFEDSLASELFKLSSSESMNIYYYFNHICNLLNTNFEISKLVKKQDIKYLETYTSSRELYNSVITRTDWVDELEYGNIMGILISVEPKKINKLAYDLDYIPINSITHTIIGFDQILEAYSNNTLESSNYLNVLSGFGVGEGNCILPIYIHKEHWKFVKLYMSNNLGLVFNRNSLDYCYNHKIIYKNVLLKMINFTFSNNDYKSEKWINLLFSVIRTNYELFKNEKLSLDKFISDKKFRINCNLNTLLIEYLLFSNNSNKHLPYIFEEVIRRAFKSIYKNINNLDKVYDFNLLSALSFENDFYNKNKSFDLNEVHFNEWLSELEVNKIFSDKITLLYGILTMKKIISENNFFDTFDKNCGILPENLSIKFRNYINENKIEAVNSQLLGCINPKFNEHVNFTKNKVFSVNTFLDLKLVENKSILYTIFIQGLIQRVNKCRLNAIKNNKYQDPFHKNNIIEHSGLLISQRFIKFYFGLSDLKDNYLNAINNINIDQCENFVKMMIKNTISVRKYVLENISIINQDRQECVLRQIKDI